MCCLFTTQVTKIEFLYLFKTYRINCCFAKTYKMLLFQWPVRKIPDDCTSKISKYLPHKFRQGQHDILGYKITFVELLVIIPGSRGLLPAASSKYTWKKRTAIILLLHYVLVMPVHYTVFMQKPFYLWKLKCANNKEVQSSLLQHPCFKHTIIKNLL